MAMVFDERLSKQLESNYRKRDFQRRRHLVEQTLKPRQGEAVLDVGCGPGFYLEELAAAVQPGGRVAGVDSSEQMVELARRRCARISNADVQIASASSLPFADASFDAAISVQVLEFVAQLDAALTELHRVLRPGGRVVIWDVDWTAATWHSDQPERSVRVLRAWGGHLSHPALPRTLASRLRAAGFTGVAVEGHAFATTDFTEDAYGVALIPAITRYAAEAGGLGEEAQNWADELRRLGETGRFFASVPQYCFAAVRP